MQKGKFGFSLWLYPFVSLWTLLVGPSVGPLLILGFVIFAERDEWVIKQCAHAVMFSIYWSVYSFIMDNLLIGSLNSIPLVGGLMSTPLRIIDTIVWIVLVILVLIQGLGRLKHGQDIGLPGKKIVNMAYGFAQNFAPQQNYPGQQYAPPAPQQYPPQQQWQQPAAPQTPPSPPPVNYASAPATPPPPQNFGPAQAQPGFTPDGLQPPPPPPKF